MSAFAAQTARVPVLLVTGFLGSGKTTLVNRLLKLNHFSRAAVVVNEYGEVSIDHVLVEAPRYRMRVVDSGCLCGHVHDEIASSLLDLQAKRSLRPDRDFDCVLIEPVPGDFESLETTAEILRQCGPRRIPAVLYAPRPLPEEKQEEISRISQGMTVRTVRSLERLLDQVALYLHVPIAELPPRKREVLETLYSSDAVLAGKRVLLVDDDIRNIFAMTSVLERQNMQVFSAETGKEAIEKLDRTDVDIVLMDIMMPDMDGYDTMREIRKKERFRGLPIIAVTAKAMKGDREKTLQAGAWDYLAKPVDTDHMLSVLRSWLHR